MNNKANRIFSYDIIRIAAVLAVVMIHVSSDAVKYYPLSSPNFIAANIFDGLSRIGVPLFVMLSGALMLNEDKSLPVKKIIKNAVNFFVLLCIWSVIYAAVYFVFIPICQGEDFSLKNFIYRSIFGHVHLWYLFMLVGLYLITPILRLFVKRENAKYILYFIVLATVFKFSLPLVNLAFENLLGAYFTNKNLVLQYVDQFYLDVLGEYVTYYFIGWYIANVKIKKSFRMGLYFAGVAGAVVTVAGNQILSTETNRLHGVFYSNGGINVMIYSVAVFILFFYLFKERDGGKLSPIITKLSSLTFGTYLVHMIILTFVSEFINIKFAPVEMFVIWMVTAVISFALSYIISKIPIVKKLIKC